MFVAANFIVAIARIIDIVLSLYVWIILARVILSWISPRPTHEIIQWIIYFIYRVTDPVTDWVRRKIPINLGPVDISPMIVLLAIYFLQSFLVSTLLDLARRMAA